MVSIVNQHLIFISTTFSRATKNISCCVAAIDIYFIAYDFCAGYGVTAAINIAVYNNRAVSNISNIYYIIRNSKRARRACIATNNRLVLVYSSIGEKSYFITTSLFTLAAHAADYIIPYSALNSKSDI